MAFPDTQWTLIAEATLSGSLEGREALGELYRRYEQPIRAHIGRRVHDSEQARDLAQAFWLHLIEERTWRRADMERGRFRHFLLAVLTNFLRDDYRRRAAARRGGEVGHTPFDTVAIADGAAPHQSAAFDRDWAVSVLERSLAELRAGFKTTERENLFVVLRKFLPGAEATPSYDDAARLAGVSTDRMRVEIHRMRTKLREILRGHIAETVATPGEIDDEFNYLRSVLGKND